MGAVESHVTEAEHWFRGEDRTFRFNVTDADGAAQNMTGWALSWKVLDKRGGTAVITKTTVSGISIGNGNGTNDRATVTVADTDTDSLDPKTYFHELKRTDDGSETVLAFGDAVLQQGAV